MVFFKKVKEIRSKDGVLHFERFAIFEIKNFASLYIHKIHESDKDPYLHTHPWNFISLILKGSYLEEVDTTESLILKTPGTISCAGRNFCHKIKEIIKGPVWTLFFVYGKNKLWYYSLGKITNDEYRKRKL